MSTVTVIGEIFVYQVQIFSSIVTFITMIFQKNYDQRNLHTILIKWGIEYALCAICYGSEVWIINKRDAQKL
jgi:hypothetical protein